MSGQILVNYEEVYSKTAELRQHIEFELHEMDATYRRCQANLQGMDGRANAAFIEAVEANQMKARVTAEISTNLLRFMELSARQIEQDEMKLKAMFDAARAKRLTNLPAQS